MPRADDESLYRTLKSKGYGISKRIHKDDPVMAYDLDQSDLKRELFDEENDYGLVDT